MYLERAGRVALERVDKNHQRQFVGQVSENKFFSFDCAYNGLGIGTSAVRTAERNISRLVQDVALQMTKAVSLKSVSTPEMRPSKVHGVIMKGAVKALRACASRDIMVRSRNVRGAHCVVSLFVSRLPAV